MNSAPDRVSADLRAANVADPHAILPTPPKTEPVHDASDESIMWMSESALLEPSSRPGNKGDRTTGAHGSASMVNLYLLAYNVSLTVGWAVILIRIVSHLAAGGSLATVYPLVRELLVVCQTAALMEIVHALAKLVRSPVGTTAIQVASRILVLYGALELGSPAVTEGSWATQTIAAWSMAEVLRYSYYAVGLLAKDSIPRFMTWLRYSGFLVLYPMGITGEMLCMYAAAADYFGVPTAALCALVPAAAGVDALRKERRGGRALARVPDLTVVGRKLPPRPQDPNGAPLSRVPEGSYTIRSRSRTPPMHPPKAGVDTPRDAWGAWRENEETRRVHLRLTAKTALCVQREEMARAARLRIEARRLLDVAAQTPRHKHYPAAGLAGDAAGAAAKSPSTSTPRRPTAAATPRVPSSSAATPLRCHAPSNTHGVRSLSTAGTAAATSVGATSASKAKTPRARSVSPQRVFALRPLPLVGLREASAAPEPPMVLPRSRTPTLTRGSRRSSVASDHHQPAEATPARAEAAQNGGPSCDTDPASPDHHVLPLHETSRDSANAAPHGAGSDDGDAHSAVKPTSRPTARGKPPRPSAAVAASVAARRGTAHPPALPPAPKPKRTAPITQRRPTLAEQRWARQWAAAFDVVCAAEEDSRATGTALEVVRRERLETDAASELAALRAHEDANRLAAEHAGRVEELRRRLAALRDAEDRAEAELLEAQLVVAQRASQLAALRARRQAIDKPEPLSSLAAAATAASAVLPGDHVAAAQRPRHVRASPSSDTTTTVSSSGPQRSDRNDRSCDSIVFTAAEDSAAAETLRAYLEKVARAREAVEDREEEAAAAADVHPPQAGLPPHDRHHPAQHDGDHEVLAILRLSGAGGSGDRLGEEAVSNEHSGSSDRAARQQAHDDDEHEACVASASCRSVDSACGTGLLDTSQAGVEKVMDQEPNDVMIEIVAGQRPRRDVSPSLYLLTHDRVFRKEKAAFSRG